MSLAVAEAPALTRPPIATPEEVSAFRTLHVPEAEAAINLMLRKIRPGVKFRQVITPLRTAVHDTCSSPVREDFSRIGCANSVLMRGLFREMLREKLREKGLMEIDMQFDFETSELWVPNEDNSKEHHKESIIQMVVYFYISQKKSRTPGKKR
ncbi:MAG TPA: hypothetical protein VIM31_04400 [Candidatus Microsaccharimonas sp.]|jgi:hypothetical protein